MTDARLRGEWLGLMKFDDLSDTAWRVFTGGLMWSAEQGTDGFIPRRYFKALHPAGEIPSAVKELEAAEVWTLTEKGAQFIDWAGVLGQSTSEQVEAYKANSRERQRRYRERQHQKLIKNVDKSSASSNVVKSISDTGDVTSDMTGDVGKGIGEGEGLGKDVEVISEENIQTNKFSSPDDFEWEEVVVQVPK